MAEALPESWLALFRCAERVLAMTNKNEAEVLLDLAFAVNQLRREYHLPAPGHDVP